MKEEETHTHLTASSDNDDMPKLFVPFRHSELIDYDQRPIDSAYFWTVPHSTEKEMPLILRNYLRHKEDKSVSV